MKKCLFLGYNSRQTSLISFLKKKGFEIKNYKKTPNVKEFLNSDLIISFGFRHIIQQNILKKIKKKIINIHLSYLPYNRGAHPNFWSFIEGTPSGISIHYIDKGIDTGNVILRKKILFDINSSKYSTFKKTYNYLFKEAENVFIKNFAKIEKNNLKVKQISSKGSFHYKKDLPIWANNWNMKIKDACKIYNKKLC